MKSLRVFSAVFIIACASGFVLKEIEKETPSVRILEDLANQTAECLRKSLTDGIPDLYIPSYDPYHFENLFYDLDILQIPDLLSGHLAVDGLVVEGFLQWVLEYIKGELLLTPITYKVQFESLYKTLDINTKYDLNITILGNNIFGKGDVSIIVSNMNSTGEFQAVLNESGIVVTKFQAPVSIKSLDFKISGLMNDPIFSELFSLAVSLAVPQIVNAFPWLFSDIVGPTLVAILTSLANEENGAHTILQMLQSCIISFLPETFNAS